ncbi:hypothetical protein BU26DRAFT_518753 [Trematosphaeria pertusa]|uniref:Uncharacterized protein n=1 Tax=Trematosphaeria pertusa TaxID=390896 RepID=A0A6A6IKI4_9PLEO|nr:uncharacterized protein BU26DRAFT_518753 [Trematosphaeria pertusa]KAF2250362.1 hypothetical protein BU26DRAFT_518753 [Trematosphaeria pertusa]
MRANTTTVLEPNETGAFDIELFVKSKLTASKSTKDSVQPMSPPVTIGTKQVTLSQDPASQTVDKVVLKENEEKLKAFLCIPFSSGPSQQAATDERRSSPSSAESRRTVDDSPQSRPLSATTPPTQHSTSPPSPMKGEYLKYFHTWAPQIPNQRFDPLASGFFPGFYEPILQHAPQYAGYGPQFLGTVGQCFYNGLYYNGANPQFCGPLDQGFAPQFNYIPSHGGYTWASPTGG